MAMHTDNTLISNREMIIELIKTPFRKLGDMIVSFAESNARTQALREIAEIPEETLRAKGLTRADAISMMFRHDG